MEVRREGGGEKEGEGKKESIRGPGLDTKHTRWQDGGKRDACAYKLSYLYFPLQSSTAAGGRERGRDRSLEGGLVVAVFAEAKR